MNQTYQNERVISDGKVIVKEMETRQLGSKQDYCAQGSYVNTTGEMVEWSVIFDGHGGNDVIHEIRQANLGEIMKGNSPHIELQQQILKKTDMISFYDGFRTGATMVLVKATFCKKYTDIEFTNIGDSSGLLYINGEAVFVTKPHNYENGEEMVRLMTEGRIDTTNPLIQIPTSIEIFSQNKLYLKTGIYINFVTSKGNTMQISPSQSLGHSGICGLKPTVSKFRLLPTDNFKVVACSDGVTDIMPFSGIGSEFWINYMKDSSAKDIVDMAEKQWRQEWSICRNYDSMNDFTKLPKTKFPLNHGYDDCCCAIMEYKHIDPLFDEMVIEMIGELVVDPSSLSRSSC